MPRAAKPRTPPRGRPPRSAAHIEDMRAQIAQHAQRLFRDEGYAAVSMRRLAAEVGCTPMTIYSYYDGKIDILQQLWAQVFQDVFKKLQRTASKQADPMKRLTALSCAYVSYWLDHTAHYRMVFMTEGVSQNEVSAFVDGSAVTLGFRILFEPLATVLELDLADPKFKLKADCLICGLHGIAHCLITISAYSWSKPDALAATLVEGLVARPIARVA